MKSGAEYLNNNVDPELSPWELERVSARDDLDRLPIDANSLIVHDLHFSFKGSEHRVILKQVRGLISYKIKQR